MPETNAMDTARRNLRKVAIFARTAGLTELDCRKIIAEEFLELEETPEQSAVRGSLEAERVWPAGCIKPNSCARNRACMYGGFYGTAGCRHQFRQIGDEVDAETARRVAACPEGALPDGATCPRCGGERAPSGINGGTWVHVRGHSADLAAVEEVRAPDGTVLKSRGLGELAARENVVPLHIVTEDGTRLERNTGRPIVRSAHDGE